MNREKDQRVMTAIIKRIHDKDFDRKMNAAKAATNGDIDRSLSVGNKLDAQLLQLIQGAKQEAEVRFWRLNRHGLAREFKRECECMADMIEKDGGLPKDIRLQLPSFMRALDIHDPETEVWLLKHFGDIEKRMCMAEDQSWQKGVEIYQYQHGGKYVLSLQQILTQISLLMKIFVKYQSTES